MQGVSEWRNALQDRGYACVEGQRTHQVIRTLGHAGLPHLLAPRPRSAADPWSLSGVYGLEAFPWHTDGAVSVAPPRWLLLRAKSLDAPTSTELLEPDQDLKAQLRRTVLRVADRLGRVRYLPAALPDGHRLRLRWDPRISSPRTGLTIDQMEQRSATAVIAWQEDLLLVVDNTRLLHRRPAIDHQGKRVLERTYVWDE